MQFGVAKPVSIMVDTFGTSKYSNEELANAVEKVFDCRPQSIIRQLKLTETKYLPLAAYGHMGREELGVEWEKTNKVDELFKGCRLIELNCSIISGIRFVHKRKFLFPIFLF